MLYKKFVLHWGSFCDRVLVAGEGLALESVREAALIAHKSLAYSALEPLLTALTDFSLVRGKLYPSSA